ncbi:hypothetical protein [Methylomonas koyamae]|uniref:hypothetical protein n=1 Tax=Methylomonas koyamae TaxID=702114 RepID=UPI0006D1ADDF|nr:hypothetical protein [Methylomonas koyamae]BBL60602.1 hypothetical protein MKFW12EY_42150 [Methylomonas koyamae]
MKLIQQRGYHWLAAICLVAGAGTAHAAINNGAPLIQASGTGSSGELYLNVWDALATTSYSIDLGTTVDDFLAGKQLSRTWSLDQKFADWASSTSDPLTFNVAGNSSYLGTGNANYGVVLSRREGASAPGGIAMTTLATWTTKVRDRANALNIAQVAQNPGATAADFEADLSEVTTSTFPTSYFNKAWGTTMSIPGWIGSAVVRNGETPDQNLDLFFVHSPGGTVLGSTQAAFDKLDGFLSLDVANAKLVWTSNVAPVPVPGAAWLFLSGILAALRLQRRTVAA